MIRIDPKSGVSIYQQIVDGVRLEVAARRFLPGDELPSVRAMAQELRINPNTVARAYRELEQMNVIETRRGAGTYVAEHATRVSDEARATLVQKKAQELVQAARQAGLKDAEIKRIVREQLSRKAEVSG